MALLTKVRKIGGVGVAAGDRTLIQLYVSMNKGGGEPQQTEGPTTEQNRAEHPAAVREEKNLHCNSHNPRLLQQQPLKEEQGCLHSFITQQKSSQSTLKMQSRSVQFIRILII